MGENRKLGELHPPLDLDEKLTVIYGRPGCMKSVMVCALARLYFEKTGKPPLLIWADENLHGEYGTKLAEFVFGDVGKGERRTLLRKAQRPSYIFSILGDVLSDKKEERYKISFVALDSVGGTIDSIMTNPENMHERSIASAWLRFIALRLETIAHKRKIPAIMIAHTIPTIQDEWHGEKERPSFTLRAIHHAEIVIKQTLEKTKEGKKVLWKIVMHRYDPDLEGKSIDVTYLIERVPKPKEIPV